MTKNSLVFVLISVSVVIVNSKTLQASESIICQECNCYRETIDCTYAKLLKLFTADQWKALNETQEFVYETLDFRFNGIKNVTRFPALPIKYLDLSQNNIVAIAPRAFYDLDQLETLDLTNNKIVSSTLKPNIFEGKYDPTMYDPLKKLKVLKLGNNLIHTLDPDIFEHLPALEELFINDNPFKVFDAYSQIAVTSIGKLKVLQMSELQLESLPEDMCSGIPTLEYLNLAHNSFKQIPKALAGCENIKELVMDGNPLDDLLVTEDQLTNYFPYLPNLERLSLSYIDTIDTIGEHTVSGLSGLKELHVHHNSRLRQIHPKAFSRQVTENNEEWPPLEIIYLNNNNLSVLAPETFGNWSQLKEINLADNPWECICDNQWLIDELVPCILAVSPGMADELSCAGPVIHSGKTFKEMKGMISCAVSSTMKLHGCDGYDQIQSDENSSLITLEPEPKCCANEDDTNSAMDIFLCICGLLMMLLIYACMRNKVGVAIIVNISELLPCG